MHKIGFALRILVTFFAVAVLLQLTTTSCTKKQVRQDTKVPRSDEKPKIFGQLGHRISVSSVAFSPDGKYAISGSWDETLKLWDISTGKAIRTFRGYKDFIHSVAFSSDGQYVLSGNDDQTMRLWSVASGREVRTFTQGKYAEDLQKSM